MAAAAKAMATGETLASEGGRLTGQPYWDRNCDWDQYTIIPNDIFNAFVDALEEWRTQCDVQDMEDTQMSYAADLKSEVIGRYRK